MSPLLVYPGIESTIVMDEKKQTDEHLLLLVYLVKFFSQNSHSVHVNKSLSQWDLDHCLDYIKYLKN